MRGADGRIDFGEWIPDAPDLNNPGLTEAQNVLHLDGSYKPFQPLATTGMNALASEPLGGIVTENYTYAGTDSAVYRSLTSLGTWTDVSSGSYTTATSWAFELFDDIVIATNGLDAPESQTIGTGSFATLAATGTAPAAYVIGKIGRFIILGNTDTAEYHIQWCAIDDPTDWPTPGSADANSKQAGEQYLNSEWGAVTGIKGGDQFGVIFQEGGLTRLNYVGGDTVFQFDEMEGSRGCFFPKSIVEAGGLWFFISKAGILATDGVSIRPIGANRVDRYFWDSYYQPNVNRVYGAVDSNRKMIFWSYPAANQAYATRILTYNYESDRFTHCEQNLNCLLSDPFASPNVSPNVSFRAFNTSHAGRLFAGTYGTAVVTTSERELNPGGFTRVSGVKPLVQWPTGVTIDETIALGTRNDQDVDNISYTSETTPHARTNFAAFRSEARYHRARLTITGQFDTAQGLEIQATGSGET